MFQRATATDPALIAVLNETLGRCRELFLNRKELWRTRERSDWLASLVGPLHSTSPPSTDEMSAMAALAFGGWCWREAERGDRSCLRDAIAAAYAKAEADPRVSDPLVTPWAAFYFLDRGGQLAEGSPGPTSEARAAFLQAAGERFHETYGTPVKMAAETASEAFHRGIALNDVERLALGRPPVLERS
jgi:hypothetical protein